MSESNFEPRHRDGWDEAVAEALEADAEGRLAEWAGTTQGELDAQTPQVLESLLEDGVVEADDPNDPDEQEFHARLDAASEWGQNRFGYDTPAYWQYMATQSARLERRGRVARGVRLVQRPRSSLGGPRRRIPGKRRRVSARSSSTSRGDPPQGESDEPEPGTPGLTFERLRELTPELAPPERLELALALPTLEETCWTDLADRCSAETDRQLAEVAE